MSKKIDEFRMPAEWEPQKSVWMSWPHNKNDWPGLFKKIPNVVGKIIKYLTLMKTINMFTYVQMKLLMVLNLEIVVYHIQIKVN